MVIKNLGRWWADTLGRARGCPWPWGASPGLAGGCRRRCRPASPPGRRGWWGPRNSLGCSSWPPTHSWANRASPLCLRGVGSPPPLHPSPDSSPFLLLVSLLVLMAVATAMRVMEDEASAGYSRHLVDGVARSWWWYGGGVRGVIMEERVTAGPTEQFIGWYAIWHVAWCLWVPYA